MVATKNRDTILKTDLSKNEAISTIIRTVKLLVIISVSFISIFNVSAIAIQLEKM